MPSRASPAMRTLEAVSYTHLVQQLAPRLFQIHAEVAQNLSGHAVSVPDEAQELSRIHI